MPSEPLAPGAQDPGAKDGKLVSHRWLGGNTLIPAYYKFDEQAAKVADFLKHGSDGKGVLNVDIFALEKKREAVCQHAVRRSASRPITIAAGETLVADVVIQNKGIGHSFSPRAARLLRVLGRFHGQGLLPARPSPRAASSSPTATSIPPRTRSPIAWSICKGELNDLHQIWHNRVLAYNNAFQSGRSQLVRYRFRLPKNLTRRILHHCHRPLSPLRSALHRLRHGRRSTTLSPSSIWPPRHAPSISATMRPSRQQPAENPEWMRWNNYGIALLDAQQYEASVARLRARSRRCVPTTPTPTPTWRSLKSPGSATTTPNPNLAKALTLLPGDPRALYYRAFVERNAGQVKEAIADLQAMLAQVPALQRRPPRARLQLLPGSTTTPRPATNMRNCRPSIPTISPRITSSPSSIAASAKKKSRPSSPPNSPTRKTIRHASVYALEFLRKHPEIAAESVAWHTHDLTGDPVQRPTKIEYKYIPGAGGE